MYHLKADPRYSDLSVRDILLFVWRWKIVGMPTLNAHFGIDCENRSLYKRVNRLIHKGYLRHRFLEDLNGFGISLTRKGFLRISDEVDCLEKNGFASLTPDHDFLVSVLHYGLQRLHSSFFISSFTEQELKNTAVEQYPLPIPKTKVHRPDGYLAAGNKATSAVVAIELEWSKKDASRYISLAEFYSKYPNVFGVWVAKTSTIAKNITNALNSNAILRGERHLVFEWASIKKDGWNAKSCYGDESNRTLANLVPSNNGNNAGIVWDAVPFEFLCLPRKTPKKTKSCKTIKIPKIVSHAGPSQNRPSLNISPAISNFDPSITHQPTKEEPPHE